MNIIDIEIGRVNAITTELESRGIIDTVTDARDHDFIDFNPTVWFGDRTVVGDITPANVAARNYYVMEF